jgi:hypothetical protein
MTWRVNSTIRISFDNDEIIIKLPGQRGTFQPYSASALEAFRSKYPDATFTDYGTKTTTVTQNITGSGHIVTATGDIIIIEDIK